MQLYVNCRLDEPVVLPMAHHHILQSIIYRSLSENPRYAEFMHDTGFQNEKRQFKLFTFGLLNGPHKIVQKNIIFYNALQWEIRSNQQQMIEMVEQYICRNGLMLLNQRIATSQIETVSSVTPEIGDEIQIRMNSPVVVYATDPETKKTIYYSPDHWDEFAMRIRDNFRRKYMAQAGEMPASDIEIIDSGTSHKKYVTKYKNFYITGWQGDFILRGATEYLQFLYDTGLGSKNSQGFGLFNLITN